MLDNFLDLPSIIWVAAYPPIPPFFGYKITTYCALDALVSKTHIEIVTLPNNQAEDEIRQEFYKYWGAKSLNIHLLRSIKNHSNNINFPQLKFKSTIAYEETNICDVLDELGWEDINKLIIFDDIIFAPFLKKYGANAILSPHDCYSKMFWSHFIYCSNSFQKFKKIIQSLISIYYEKSYYQLALLVHLVTNKDRYYLERINQKASYHVISNNNIINPDFNNTERPPNDVIVWANLNVVSSVRGTIEFLKEITNENILLGTKKIILVGRVPEIQAKKILGDDLFTLIKYQRTIENEDGIAQSAKIVLIPDIGGVGVKSRAINVLSSGLCLACLYPQMEGFEKVSDIGAINAHSMQQLVILIRNALQNNHFKTIGAIGNLILQRDYSSNQNKQLWYEMILRATTTRENNKLLFPVENI